MQLRGIEYGSLFCAPGARGFFGEGYPFHPIWKVFGMTWWRTTFVAKTTTLLARSGNMPLKRDGITPKEWIPGCIVVKPLSGHVLNAVDLSGPGAQALLEAGHWQERTEPFMLSFMSVAATKHERLAELRAFVQLLKHYLPYFRTMIVLQLNFACPNAGLHIDELVYEIEEALEIAAELHVPLVPNFNPLVPVQAMLAAANHPACDALWIANTIPWGDPRIDWVALFGTTKSPLLQRGLPSAGGLSGPACLPFVIEKLLQAKEAGIEKPVVAGNGVQSLAAAEHLIKVGAAGVALGVIGIMRPWRMASIIEKFTG